MIVKRLSGSAEAGFTLLELLVSITILSLILVALTGGVHFAGNAWRVQERVNARQGDINAVQAVLRQMLASGKGFDGSTGNLRFVGKLPAALARGGLFDIELSSDGDRLVLSWRPHLKSARGATKETALLEGLVTVAFAYHDNSQGWQRLVNAKSKPLDLISFSARLSNGRVWPTLLVAPAISAPAKPKA